MCDTFFISQKITEDGSRIFCKNSDRPYGESQAIVLIGPETRSQNTIKATYINVGFKPAKHTIFLGKPFWMWGGEFAINENGVCIGNEALFTKVKIKGNNGLLGMDMLRISAEISDNAEESVENIIELLEKYGQDANSAYNKEFRYHNSFLITDPQKTFYIETVGRNYAVKEIKEDFFSISNKMQIRSKEECILSNMESPQKYERKLFSFLAGGTERMKKIRKEIERIFLEKKKISLKDCFRALKIHGFGPRSVCMHYGIFSPSQTSNSVVVKLHKNGKIILWATGTPHACISLFKPFSLKNQIPNQEFFLPSGKPDETLWWLSLKLHERLFKDTKALEEFTYEINQIQDELLSLETQIDEKSVYEISLQSINKELQTIKKFLKELKMN